MKTVVIDWNKRRIETHFGGALFIRRFDAMYAASGQRVVEEIRKLTEAGYQPTRPEPHVWVYTRGAMA